MQPREIMRWFHETFRLNNKYDFEEDFYDKLSDEQLKKLNMLQSAERASEMIMRLPEKDLTIEDWYELRATDFNSKETRYLIMYCL